MWKCQQEQRVFPTVWLRNCPSQYSKEYSSLYYTPLNWTTPLQPSFTAVYFLSGKKVMTGAWKGHLQVTSKKQVLLYYEYRARFCKWQYANSSILLYTHTHLISLFIPWSHIWIVSGQLSENLFVKMTTKVRCFFSSYCCDNSHALSCDNNNNSHSQNTGLQQVGMKTERNAGRTAVI